MGSQRNIAPWRLYVVGALLSAGIFAVDIHLPLEFVGGVPYIVAVFITLWVPHPRFTYLMMVIGIALTGLGYLLSPLNGTLWAVIGNRLLTVLAILVTGLLTVLAKAERHRTEQTAHLLTVAEQVGDTGSWEWNPATGQVSYSANACHMYGIPSEHFSGSFDQCFEHVHPDDRTAIATAIYKMIHDKTPERLDYRVIRPDGQVRFITGTSRLFLGDHGEIQRLVSTLHDVTPAHLAATKLEQSEHRYRSLMAVSPVATQIIQDDGTVTDVNRKFTELFGYTLDDFSNFSEWAPLAFPDPEYRAKVTSQWGMRLTQAATSGGEMEPMEVRITGKDNTEKDIVIHYSPTGGEGITIFQDVTAQKRNEATLRTARDRLVDLTLRDELTHIPNRRRYDAALAEYWQQTMAEGAPLSVLMIDVDFFKNYNDHYGHQAGDEVLRRVAATILATLRRPTDLVARYGGEEFAVLLPHTESPVAAAIAERIRRAVEGLAIPHENSPIGDVLTLSVGHATELPAIGDRPDHLMAEADVSLYCAKSEGRNRVALSST